MNYTFNQYVIFKLGMLLLWTAVGACGAPGSERSASPTLELPVIEVSKGTYTGYEEYPSSIEGVQNIEIRAKVSGYIQEIFVDEGQAVRKGTPLFKLETASLSQDAGAAQSAVKTAEARVETARLEVDKIKPLVEKGVIGEIQLATAEANLSAAQSQLEQTKSTYQSIRANIGYSRIESPVAGVIGKMNLRQGSLVGPSTQTPLTTVSNIEQVYAYFSLNERDFLQLTSSLGGNSLAEKLSLLPEVLLVMADGSTYPHKGRIDAATGNIDPTTGAIRLRAVFDNPERMLRNGSSGTIKIPREYENQIAIPAMSTFEQQGKRMVYMLTAGDTLRVRSVSVLDEVDRVLIIDQGLEAGEIILARGIGKVRPGSVIIPKSTPMDSITQSFTTIFK